MKVGIKKLQSIAAGWCKSHDLMVWRTTSVWRTDRRTRIYSYVIL